MAPLQEIAHLPVQNARVRQMICEKVESNPVTLIAGRTGSGKSSQVPQMLLDTLGGPVLISQPRRVAAVSLARRVASERGCELGEEVGYRIGQERLCGPETRMVFCTCGILLEELLVHGPSFLEGYTAVVVDEVHERSVESDLCLAIIRQHLLSGGGSSKRLQRTRFVTMSATFDLQRYRDFFGPCLGRDERLEVIAIPDHGSLVTAHLVRTRELYLEDAVKRLSLKMPPHEKASYAAAVEDVMSRDMLGTQALAFVARFVAHLHQSDPDRSTKHMLVFLPTYRSLEDCYGQVAALAPDLDVHALHSSTDTEACNRAIEECTGRRKLILATNVAESSLTIQDLAYVIDLCRNVEVAWDHSTQSSMGTVRWASKSQARQRAGRTGRTCSGTVYRLVPRATFNAFSEFETPSLLLASLREESLRLCCSRARATSDAQGVLQNCLNPPEQSCAARALEALVHMKAVAAPALSVKALRGRDAGQPAQHEPTPYGRLLASMPISLPQARMVVAAASRGFLHEGSVLAAVQAVVPCPIRRPFAKPSQYAANMRRFNGGCADEPLPFDSELANLAAVLLWQLHCHMLPLVRLLAMERTVVVMEGRDRLSGLPDLAAMSFEEQAEVRWRLAQRRAGAEWASAPAGLLEAWCGRWHLLQSSLAATFELALELEAAVHRLSPVLQSAGCGARRSCWWRRPPHCLHFPQLDAAAATSAASLIGEDAAADLRGLLQAAAKPIPALAVPVCLPVATAASSLPEYLFSPPRIPKRPSCVFFAQGRCSRGASCLFAHDGAASALPVCRNFGTAAGCKFGASCRYRHPGEESGASGSSRLSECLSRDGRIVPPPFPEAALRNSGLDAPGDGAALLLASGRDGRDLAAALERHLRAGNPRRTVVAPLGGKGEGGLSDVDARDLHRDAGVLQLDQDDPLGLVVCVFPGVPAGCLDDLGQQRAAIEQIFCSAGRLAASSLAGGRFQICMVLHPEHFCSWRVFQAARQLGWALEDVSGLPVKAGSLRAAGRPAKDARVYTFSNAIFEAVAAEAEALCSGVPARCWPAVDAPCCNNIAEVAGSLAGRLCIQVDVHCDGAGEGEGEGESTPTHSGGSSFDAWPSTPPTDERLMKSVMMDIMNADGEWESD